jgi:hypothetical protein
MRVRGRILFSALGCLASLVGATALFARDLPNLDALSAKGRARKVFHLPAGPLKELVRADKPLHTHEIFGVPTFLWASEAARAGEASPRRRGLGPEAAAREHLGRFAPLYELDPDEARSAELGLIHDTGRGAVIVSFKQRIHGIPVFRDEMKLIMNRDLELVALSGYLAGSPALSARRSPPGFERGAREAVARAYGDLTGAAVLPVDFLPGGKAEGDYELIRLRDEVGSIQEQPLLQPARIRKVFFHLPDRLEPAWYVELDAGSKGWSDSDLYAYVVSATDGAILFRNNLTVRDAFSYRVWAQTSTPFLPGDGPQGTVGTPHPTGTLDGYQAPFIAPSLVTLQNGPISTNDPWLPAGATQTTGNNAEAYADLISPDGFSAGDLRATTTSANTFDRTYDTTLAPPSSANQQMAAITQLFYDVNLLHDWFYDSGFNEASGNAQTNNFGRGGLGNDSLRAEAQDFSGRNNANMSTAADGARSRMQMYVFDGVGARALNISSPAPIAGAYAVGVAQFGPLSFNTTNSVVLVNDGAAPTTDACTTPFSNAAALAGKIAFVDRGNCSFAVKVKNAQLNGAIGAIIANNVAPGILDMGGTDATITIPSLLISLNDGNAIRAQLGVGVSANLFRAAGLDRDGTIDNAVVAHEWGHFISNRLIGDANGLSNQQGGGMGEGWGDFHSLLMAVRSEDSLIPANANFNGVYAMGAYVNGGGPNGNEGNQSYYFGFRRVPYSTDMTKSPLTFQHISDGVPLPGGVPISFGADGSNNSEVHNTGEVWATMLWECYAALLRDTGRLTFDEARERMRDYLVAAYKMTPSQPTFLEARDALLAAAFANDNADFALFAQAFARRGAGIRAVAPSRYSINQTGVIESYTAGGDLTFVSATLDDNLVYCDHDGVLDTGETGHLTITLRNTGSQVLSATTATITSSNPALTIPAGAVSFPSSQPFGTTVATVIVQMGSASGIQSLPLTITFNDPGFAIAGAVSVPSAQRGNYDDVPNQSASDDVESSTPRWTPSNNPALDGSEPWRRLEATPTDHRWLGPDSNEAADHYLVSPALSVAATGSFSFTFSHRYSFEFQGTTFFDGGVIELSNNGGASWTSIGASASPGYTGIIVSGGGNPLSGLSAYTGASPGYPGFSTVTVSLGTAYQGQTVRIRFRIGTDVSVGAPGWEIDNLVFSNLTNLPFNVLVPDAHVCIDTDSDGVPDLNDCSPSSSSVWAVPSEAWDLLLDGPGLTTFSWIVPSSPGGTTVLYDLVRDSLATFAGAACVESGGTDLTAVDGTNPVTVLFYLVRSRNACGGNLGFSSQAVPRTAPACP